MPGKVLIVDTIATNRIVMKVKLAAAGYEIAQAASGSDGLEIAHQFKPDLVLCASHLPDMAITGFAAALRNHGATRTIPLLVEMLERDREARHAILEAGADDLLLKPCPDHLLLARLRSLMRQRETAEDLTLREGANRALGLSEAPERFVLPGDVALIAPDGQASISWQRKLYDYMPGRLTALPLQEAQWRLGEAAPPDAIALVLSPQFAETGLHLLADLHAKPDTRDIGVLVLIEGNAPASLRLATDALDRGACGVVTEGFDPREIALYLQRQIVRKHTLARLRADMRDGLRAALTDPLTGLYNRRHALPRMAAMAELSTQRGGDFAAMVIDVDHFKLINDRFGHAAGDQVLVQLARHLSNAVGPRDLLARIGGEEFLVVMPDTARTPALLAAKRICRAIREAPFRITGSENTLEITVSIGVALGSDVRGESGPPPIAETVSAISDAPLPTMVHQQVLDQADKALYGAKADGRNKVTLSGARSAA